VSDNVAQPTTKLSCAMAQMTCVGMGSNVILTNQQSFLPIRSRTRESPELVDCLNSSAMLCSPEPFLTAHTQKKKVA